MPTVAKARCNMAYHMNPPLLAAKVVTTSVAIRPLHYSALRVFRSFDCHYFFLAAGGLVPNVFAVDIDVT